MRDRKAYHMLSENHGLRFIYLLGEYKKERRLTKMEKNLKMYFVK